jgi:predicted phage terminase large subunit-like protein
LIVAHEPQCWFGEAGPIRRAVEPFLTKRMNERRAYCRTEWLPSIHDKPTRSRPFQALASMGKVLLPKQAPWKADLLGQLMRFPAGKYDDGVDVCSLLGRGIEHVRLPRARKVSAEPRRFGQAGGEASGWMGI